MKLDFDTLAGIAKAATDAVRADAARQGVTLPVWHGGKVMWADPQTDELFARETDRPAEIGRAHV